MINNRYYIKLIAKFMIIYRLCKKNTINNLSKYMNSEFCLFKNL